MRILICLMFKDSNMWLSRFFDNIDNLLNNEFNQKNNIEYYISVVYSTSNDGTEEALKDRLQKYKENSILTKIDVPSRFSTLEKLAILRNTFLNVNNLEKYDYLLMIDTDVMFDPFSINRLIKDINNPKIEDIGIIAPMIFIENYGTYKNTFFYDVFAYRMRGLNFKHRKPYIPVTLHNNKKYKRIIEVDSVGSLYLIKSDILTSNKNVHYGTYIVNTPYENKKHESEQVYLCEQVKKANFKIYVDLNVRVFHINLENYGLKWH